MKKAYLALLLTLVAFTGFSQKDVDINRNTSFFDRVYFGGGLGFSTGSGFTNISLSPIAGYMITNNFSAGVGINYQYVKYKDPDESTDLYGGSLFVRYNIKQFFVQSEYNIISYEVNPFNDNIDDRSSSSRVLLGGGISQPLGKRGSFNILGLYDLTYKESGPYASPWVFRVFFAL